MLQSAQRLLHESLCALEVDVHVVEHAVLLLHLHSDVDRELLEDVHLVGKARRQLVVLALHHALALLGVHAIVAARAGGRAAVRAARHLNARPRAVRADGHVAAARRAVRCGEQRRSYAVRVHAACAVSLLRISTVLNRVRAVSHPAGKGEVTLTAAVAVAVRCEERESIQSGCACLELWR